MRQRELMKLPPRRLAAGACAVRSRPLSAVLYGACEMTNRRMILIALLVTAAHFALSSLLGYYVAHEVGGRAGENIARFITETYESKDATSEAAIAERERDLNNTIDTTVVRWQPVFVLLSLPIGFALEPLFEPVTRSWYDQALSHELSLPQWSSRMWGIVAVEYVLNSAFLGLLVYVALRLARRFHAS